MLPGTTHMGLVTRSNLLVRMKGELLDAVMPEGQRGKGA